MLLVKVISHMADTQISWVTETFNFKLEVWFYNATEGDWLTTPHSIAHHSYSSLALLVPSPNPPTPNLPSSPTTFQWQYIHCQSSCRCKYTLSQSKFNQFNLHCNQIRYMWYCTIKISFYLWRHSAYLNYNIIKLRASYLCKLYVSLISAWVGWSVK